MASKITKKQLVKKLVMSKGKKPVKTFKGFTPKKVLSSAVKAVAMKKGAYTLFGKVPMVKSSPDIVTGGSGDNLGTNKVF